MTPKEKAKESMDENDIRRQANEFAKKWLPKWEKYCDVCKGLNCKNNDKCINCGCKL